jgi:hypothetical protein
LIDQDLKIYLVKKMNSMVKLCALVLIAGLSACGGGGGSPGTTSGDTGSTGNETPAVNAPSITVTMTNADGAEVTGISLAGGFTVRATVLDATGAVVKNKLISFEVTGSSVAVVSPSTALTNDSGIASVNISPASVTSVGAATLSASADVSGVTVESSKDFSIQATNVTLSTLSIANNSLPSGGNTAVSVTALLNGVPASATPVNVNFSASCGRINDLAANTSSPVSLTTNGAGVATVVYTALDPDGKPCSGNQTITASSSGVSSPGTVNVAGQVATAINYVSASLSQIFIKDTGATDQSIVTFKVLDSSGLPMANEKVRFSVVTNPGGVSLGVSGSTSNVEVETTPSGNASVVVFAGGIPGPVKVRADLLVKNTGQPTGVFSESQNLTVASGPPAQNRLSLAVETFNIEGWNIDGTRTLLTVRAADRQGNAVVDGTVINFTSEAGQVARSCSTVTIDKIASCSVVFESSEPRPTGGRSSILAFAEGTKDYVDNNNNNIYDVGDTLLNMGNAYRDDDEDGAFDSGEFALPRGGVSVCSGIGAPAPAAANTCDGLLGTTVRKQTVILYSSSQPAVPNGAVDTLLTRGGLSFQLRSFHNPLLPMPAGTRVETTIVDNTKDNNLSCSVGLLAGTPVVNVSPGTNPNADLSTPVQVLLKECAPGDTLTVSVVAPSGLKTTLPTFNIP